MVTTKAATDRAANSFAIILTYNLPVIGYGFMYMLFSMYYLKFSTDVLFLPPAIIGTIFALSRVWDAVTDPVAGYLSDRTVHRLGRRRPWILYCAIPLGLSFVMAFSPPESLGDTALIAWAAVSVFTFYLAGTAFVVPHMSLGAELSYESGNRSRSRLFAYRYGALALGYLIAVGALTLLIQSEGVGAAATRSTALQVTVVAALVMAVFLAITTVSVRERKDFQGRSGSNPFTAFADVVKNQHARKILFVTFAEYTGLSVTGVMALYVTEYVLGRAEYGPLFLLVWLVLSLGGVPIWLHLTRIFTKKKLWISSLLLSAVSYGSLIVLQEGAITHMMVVMIIAGFAAACGGTIGPAIQSDVIDYDEFKTGERKEGAYFACWNLVVKAAAAVTVFLAGLVLHWSGFEPKVDQTDSVKMAMLAYLALFPFIMYVLAAVVLSRFTFEEKEHAEVRAAIEKRE